jgi:hypothetical protein
MMEDGSTGTALSLVDTWPFLLGAHREQVERDDLARAVRGERAAQGTRHDYSSQVGAGS